MLFRSHDAVHVFHNDNGVIHDYTDGKNKSQQGQHVQGKAEQEHHSECSDKGNRDGNDRNHGSPPVLQRQEYDQNHKQKRLEEGPVNIVD